MQALTAWGALWLELEQLNLNASIIHAEGDIKFHKPLTTNITVTSTVDDPAAFAETLQAKGKVTLSMNASAGDGDHLASNFSGVYSVRLS